MGEENKKVESIIAELTPEEQQLLAKALKRLENDLFHSVLKRFSLYLITTIGVLTLAGIINFYALSEKIENSAVQKLTTDPVLREKIATDALEIEKENARATSTFINDLREINFMLRQVKADLSKRLPSTTPSDNRNRSKSTR